MRGLFKLFKTMETQFYILLSLKTPHGFADYGQYFLAMTAGRPMNCSGS